MKYCIFFLFGILLAACDTPQTPTSQIKETKKTENKPISSDEELLTLVQKNTFQYFWNGAEPTSGLARERIHMDGDYPHNDQNVVTTGGSGFGVMAILVGIERGFITRQEGFERLNKIADYLEKADRFHGAWSHWIYGETGKIKPFSKYDDGGDLVETSFLIQGLLAVRQYFREGNDAEKQLAEKIDKLWKGVEWNWYTGPDKENTLYWHWSPNHDWKMKFPLSGYNECLITHVLAASSPTYPTKPEVYHEGWAKSGDIVSDKEMYGYPLVLNHNFAEEYGGPLFWAHYSYLGLNPKGLKDKYADYWQLNTNQSLINYRYCVENPKKYTGYSEKCWGLTASYTLMENGKMGYNAHAPMKKDFGVITPTAALSSMPYTPKESLAATQYFYEELGDKLFGEYGFYDAFHLGKDWFEPKYLAIDQGPIVVMIENHRSGLLWNLFMSAPEVQAGLDKLGFTYTKVEATK